MFCLVLASGFSAILAYGLARMNGLGGLEGWRWIFIMLGLVTIVAGTIGWFLIVDFPDKAKFLTEDEKRDGGCLFLAPFIPN